MQINWRLRFKNKVTLWAIIVAVVTFIYQLLGVFGITPAISQNEIINLLGLLVNIFVLLGIVTDPTTDGVNDSARAMGYLVPNFETSPDEDFPMGGEAAGDSEEAHEALEPDDEDSEV